MNAKPIRFLKAIWSRVAALLMALIYRDRWSIPLLCGFCHHIFLPRDLVYLGEGLNPMSTIISVVFSKNGIPMGCGRNAMEAWGTLGRFGWRENRRFHRAMGWQIRRCHALGGSKP